MIVRANRPVRVVRRPYAPVPRPHLPVLLVLIAGAPLLAGDAPSPIPWRANFETAEAEARRAGRPLWLQFTGPWCAYCVRMEREVFPRPEVVALGGEAYLPVKVDSNERPDLLERFGISGLPSTVLVAADGREIGRREGYSEPGEFLAFLAAHRPAPAPAGTRGAGEPEIALAGYDPVSLVSGAGLTEGRPSLSVRYDGLEFRFAEDEDRAEFLREPERFLPVGRGRCPVRLIDAGEAVAGHPRHGVYYRGRLYLCADESARRRFAADPSRYADADLAENGHCPHCRTLAGRRVRGLPQFSAIYRGHRYLFPDAEHREAFRSSPETYLR